MRAWRRVIFISLLLAFAAPPVLAAPSEAELFVRGPVSLPAGVLMEARFSSLYLDDTADLALLSLEARVAQVHVYEWSSVVLPGSTVAHRTHEAHYSWSATNLSLSASSTGASGGFVGVYSAPSGITGLAIDHGAAWESRSYSYLGRDGGELRVDSPHRPWYSQHITDAHLHASVPGAVRVDGPGAIKIFGAAVRVASDQNVTLQETGVSGSDVVHLRQRWVYIAYEGGELHLETSAPIEIAAYELSRLRWTGTVSLASATGAISVDGQRHEARGEPVALTGTFEGRLSPTSAGRQALLTLGGDLRGTSLARIPIATSAEWPASGQGFGLGTVLMGAAMAGIVGVGATTLVRRPRGGRLTIDECIATARVAARAQESEHAAAWLAKARKLSPADPAILQEEAWHLARVGRLDAAIGNYIQASHLLPLTDGSANLAAAFLHFEKRGDMAACAREIAIALQRDPKLLTEIESETTVYRALQGSAIFDSAVAAAARQLERLES